MDDPLSYPHEFEHITLSRLLLAHYQNDRSEQAFREVVGLLERLRQAAEEGGRWGRVIEILVLQAVAHQVQGNITLALRVLEQALTRAHPEGCISLFTNEAIPMPELLKRVAAKRGCLAGLGEADRLLQPLLGSTTADTSQCSAIVARSISSAACLLGDCGAQHFLRCLLARSPARC